MKKLTLLGLTFAAAIAQATVIGPGTTVLPSEVASAVGVGSLQLLTISGNYNFNVLPPPDISASYVETAYADTTNPFNPVAAGVYDTTIVLKITVGKGTANIERATLGYFGGFQASVSYLAGSPVPINATRDTTLDSVIGYQFAGLTPGQVETLVIYTNGQGANYGGTVSVQDGTVGDNVGLSTGPEPVSLNLVGGGLALLLLKRCRKALKKP